MKFLIFFSSKQRKQREVRKINESYVQLINQALPIEVQQEVEKERISREKGSFTESYDEYSNLDGNSPSSTSSPSNPLINSLSSSSSTILNSQTQLNNQSTSLPCTVSKRPQKLNNNTNDDSLTTNSLVQTTTTTRNTKISNGNDDDNSSTYKQQKKQLIKSSNNTQQSRRQQKKQETKEQIRPTSRDSSESYNNGFPINTSIENSDIEKKYSFHFY